MHGRLNFNSIQILILVLASGLLLQVSTAPVVDPAIAEKIKTDKVANILISFSKSNTKNLANQFDGSSLNTQEEKLNGFHKLLKAHADEVQGATLKLLKEEVGKKQGVEKPLRVNQLWTTNQILVSNADQEILDKLTALPDISAIDGEKVLFQVPPNEVTTANGRQAGTGTAWGVKFIKADQIWSKGNKGKGIVIGFIDSGVRHTHEALRGNFRSSYGWFDPIKQSKAPVDEASHGTLVVGTAVGQMKEIGVAPEAQWIACRIFDETGKATDAAIKACFNWMTCPTDVNGDNPDCSKAPKIINHSYQLPDKKTNAAFIAEINQTISKWIQSGILPIFEAGNGGPTCGSIERSYLGDENILMVGSCNEEGVVAALSSSGPIPGARRGLYKPDVVAPGSNVFSSVANSDTAYTASVGATAYATPHVSGLAALYFSQFPETTVAQFVANIKGTARGGTVKPGADPTCGGIPSTVFPNHRGGFGIVDAVALLQRSPTGEDIKIFSRASPNPMRQSFKISLLLVIFNVIQAMR